MPRKDGTPTISKKFLTDNAIASFDLAEQLLWLIQYSIAESSGQPHKELPLSEALIAMPRVAYSRLDAERQVAAENCSSNAHRASGGKPPEVCEYERLIETLTIWARDLLVESKTIRNVADDVKRGRPSNTEPNIFIRYGAIEVKDAIRHGRPPADLGISDLELLSGFARLEGKELSISAISVRIATEVLRNQGKRTTGSNVNELASRLRRRRQELRRRERGNAGKNPAI